MLSFTWLINSLAQGPIVAAHFGLLILVCILSVIFRQRQIAHALWAAGFATCTLFGAGLTLLFLPLLLMGGGGAGNMFSPLAFMGGPATALGGYAAGFIVYLVLKPKPFELPPPTWGMAVGTIILINSIWLFMPAAIERSVVFQVLTYNDEPIAGALVDFDERTSFEQEPIETDAEGVAKIQFPWGGVVQGKVSCPGYAGGTFYVAQREGGDLAIVQNTETQFIGGLSPLKAYFIYTTKFHNPTVIDVYLQKIGEGYPLPFKPLQNLVGQMKEAAQLAAAGGEYPYILSSGDVFNPQAKLQSVEAYGQLSEWAKAYDPKGPLRSFLHDDWDMFTNINETLKSRLSKITDMPDSDPAKAANALILAQLLNEAGPPSTTRDYLNRVAKRLANDAALIKRIKAE